VEARAPSPARGYGGQVAGIEGGTDARELFTKLSVALIAVSALAGRVLSVIAIAKLREGSAVAVENAATDCRIQQNAGRSRSGEWRPAPESAQRGGDLRQVGARARGNTQVTARRPPCGDPEFCSNAGWVAYPLRGNSWAQRGDESNTFLAQARLSATSNRLDNGCGPVELAFYVDGRQVGVPEVGTYPGERSETHAFEVQEDDFGSGSAGCI
jgi:hypothetical protein